MSYTRRSLTAALVQINMTGIPFDLPSASDLGFEAGEDSTAYRETIARAQTFSTNDELAYAPVFQIGYGGVVEHVPLRTQGSGQLQTIEIVDLPSLYRLGIYDFIGYLMNCTRNPIEIAIHSFCNEDSGAPKEVDRLTNVKFTGVARMIDVGGQLVPNSASFVYIRSLSSLMADMQ